MPGSYKCFPKWNGKAILQWKNAKHAFALSKGRQCVEQIRHVEFHVMLHLKFKNLILLFF